MTESTGLARKEYTKANRQMWNETADMHAEVRGQALLDRVAAPDFSTFKDVETRLIAKIGLAGKSVAQLACNNIVQGAS